MKPPPMTAMDAGRSSIRMMVSEVWKGTVSSPGMSGTTGRDPTATMNVSAVIRSAPTCSTRGATNRPSSVYTSTPFSLR